MYHHRSLALKAWMAFGTLILLAAIIGVCTVSTASEKTVMGMSGLLVAFTLFVLWDDTR